MGAFTSKKNERRCDPALVGPCGICCVSGLLFQSHSWLSCQPGPGVAVCFMLFHVFPFPGIDFPEGMSPQVTCSSFSPRALRREIFFFYPLLMPPSHHPVAVHLEWLGTHFHNGMKNQQIAYTVNCWSLAYGSSTSVQWLLLASAWSPTRRAHPPRLFSVVLRCCPHLIDDRAHPFS